jgi:hypothetical protein
MEARILEANERRLVRSFAQNGFKLGKLNKGTYTLWSQSLDAHKCITVVPLRHNGAWHREYF